MATTIPGRRPVFATAKASADPFYEHAGCTLGPEPLVITSPRRIGLLTIIGILMIELMRFCWRFSLRNKGNLMLGELLDPQGAPVAATTMAQNLTSH